MKNSIKKVCVIGSGVMGAGIAAVIANSSHQVILLDLASKDQADKNAIVVKALERMKTQKPAPLAYPDKVKFITVGNLEDDLALIKECDLVIEVIIEKIELKHQLYNKIIPYLKDGVVLASNTSTLPLNSLKAGIPKDLRPKFLITHFFNPPRYMDLVELVTDQETAQSTINHITNFLTRELGKTIVKCNDTPGFIANRIGCFLLEVVVRKAIKQNLNPAVIDRIFSSLLYLPSTGIFGLYDLIGHDVMKLISESLINSLPAADSYHKIYINTPILDKMAEQGLVGRKSDGGFYRVAKVNGKKDKQIINFSDLSYGPVIDDQERFSSLTDFLSSNSVYSKFFSEVLVEFYLYLVSLIPSVTDNINDIDLAMTLGYSWKMGPFELLARHIPQQFINLNFTDEFRTTIKQLSLASGQSELAKPVELAQIILFNDSAKLLQYKDSLLFTINTKMNCLNTEIFELLIKAVDYAEDHNQDLYIYPKGEHFSAGADLKFIVSCLEHKNFKLIEEFLKLGQKTMMRLRYSSVNIISCALGAALGGGCELLLHSDFIIAHQELKAGLVEVGVGLVPGWGGIKEMFLRSHNDKDLLIKALKNIIEQNKSSSAEYFVADYQLQNYKIIMNEQFLLEDALKLKLPAKTTDYFVKAKLPAINLADELNIEFYSDLQKDVVASFQQIINLQEVEEFALLDFERQKFLELCHKPETLKNLQMIL